MQLIDAEWETNLHAYFLSTETQANDLKLFQVLWAEPTILGTRYHKFRNKAITLLYEAHTDPANLDGGFTVAEIAHTLSRWGVDKRQIGSIMGKDPRFVKLGKSRSSAAPVWGLLQNIEFDKMMVTLDHSRLFVRGGSEKKWWRLTEWTGGCAENYCWRWVDGSTHCSIHLDKSAESTEPST